MADRDTPEVDALSGVETTGHEWDGLRELNNPLPRWWVWIFAATCVWALIYWVLYPSWPVPGGYIGGLWGSTQRAEVTADYEAMIATRNVQGAGLIDARMADIVALPEKLEFAMAAGSAAYAVHCVSCHGSGALGGEGYPNLQDDVWLWGGTLDAIHQTILYGIRAEHEETRFGEMPAFADVLSAEEIDQVTNFIADKAGVTPENGVDLAAGAEVYDINCSSCHGVDLEGVQELGAPNLADRVWLYGSSLEGIRSQIIAPRNGVMPAFASRLDPVTVKALAVYIHNLGGGERE